MLKLYTARNVDENFDNTENTVQEVDFETNPETLDEDVANPNTNISAGRAEQYNSRSRKRRKPDEVEIRLLKALEDDAKPINRHLSFFHSVIPAVEKLDDSEVLQFQMGVLQLISNINEQKRRASLVPSFSAQPPLLQPHFYPQTHQPQYTQASAQYDQNIYQMPTINSALNRSLGSPCSSSSTTLRTAITHPLSIPSPIQSTSSCNSIDFAELEAL